MLDGVGKNGVFVGVKHLAVARHVVRPFVLSRADGLLFFAAFVCIANQSHVLQQDR